MSSSTPIATFAGIGSSFDAETLITNMVTAEKAPETAMQGHQSDLTSQISTLGSIASGLQSLGTAASALSTLQGVQSVSATSGNSSLFTATAAATAAAGNYNISISHLATAQTSASGGFPASNVGSASGSLTLSVGGKTPPYSVDYGANESLADVAAAINQTANGDVNASVIYDGSSYRLIVTGGATGAANAVTFGDSNHTFNMATSQAATDSAFTVNGVSMTRPSNTVSDAISGVTMNFATTTPAGGAATSLTVGNDPTALATKLTTLVNAYNSVAKQVSGQLSYNGVTKGADTLFGDASIQGLEQQLGDLFANGYSSGSGPSLTARDLGMTLNADGTVTLDQTQLTQALTANPNAAQQLLLGNGTKGSGLSGAIAGMVNNYTAYGTGSLVTEQASKKSQYDSYTKQIANVDAQADTLETKLRSDFAQLDEVMSNLTSQQNSLNMMFNTSSSSSSK